MQPSSPASGLNALVETDDKKAGLPVLSATRPSVFAPSLGDASLYRPVAFRPTLADGLVLSENQTLYTANFVPCLWHLMLCNTSA